MDGVPYVQVYVNLQPILRVKTGSYTGIIPQRSDNEVSWIWVTDRRKRVVDNEFHYSISADRSLAEINNDVHVRLKPGIRYNPLDGSSVAASMKKPTVPAG